jgi:hypothetical protein
MLGKERERKVETFFFFLKKIRIREAKVLPKILWLSLGLGNTKSVAIYCI